MAGDRGSEERRANKKKRVASDADSSDEDGRSKRHRSTESKSGRSSKRGGGGREEKSRRRRSKSHENRKHHSSKEGKHGSSHSKDGHHWVSSVHLPELTDDDYYSKNNEFCSWLKEERNKFFSDLSSESARKLFSEFIIDWNQRKLESKYYEGISTAPRSAHKWKIKS